MADYAKPVPAPSTSTRFFWEGCRAHQLVLQRCSSCDAFRFPPSVICPECLSTDWEVAPLSGRGTVHTFGVYHRLYHKAFEPELPYVVGIIELEEGPRLLSNVVGCRPEDVYCGMSVRVVFEDITDEATLYKFEPDSPP
ncbi:MAG: Zn-ribbon domain-containing OB-fold protein [Chloroflexota bacterium]|nr:Zn-ribbon domain-containing OB-fold protein [Chloroflexota bacterium]MDE2886444.1 Zn-ribbon domain-containing OB-fold protein [Chloroflexota bacterium]